MCVGCMEIVGEERVTGDLGSEELPGTVLRAASLSTPKIQQPCGRRKSRSYCELSSRELSPCAWTKDSETVLTITRRIFKIDLEKIEKIKVPNPLQVSWTLMVRMVACCPSGCLSQQRKAGPTRSITRDIITCFQRIHIEYRLIHQARRKRVFLKS